MIPFYCDFVSSSGELFYDCFGVCLEVYSVDLLSLVPCFFGVASTPLDVRSGGVHAK